ncbi:hypothetical protein FQR65_LT19321 [Abscondita terminalis]|nr:hypothetical protein FQR65_LT19321 [Abscondita terminalis]
MITIHTYISALLLSSVLGQPKELVDYYVQLIESETNRSQTFSLPIDSQSEKPFNDEFVEYGTFDHIVVGAGSAGAIVASRLSEDKFRDVLLLEAGGPQTNLTEIPGAIGVLWNLEYNWNYYTEPQSAYCLGMKERRCAYQRGKVIGGSSSINGLVYTRGSKKDFDNWCAEGNTGWCYKDVLPYFKKLENYTIGGSSSCHGFEGYINVEYSKPHTKKQRAFIDANVELNRTFVDYNGFRQEGVGITQMSTVKGRRCSTGTTYLKTASKRNNLKISIQSHATKILINPNTKTAFGVLFAKNNKILRSPQLLMLSGIGPKQHLQQLRIPIIENLSVGENFQDHVGFPMMHVETSVPEPDKTLEENVKDYLNGVGALTNAFNAKGIAFVRTNLTKIDDFADIEILTIGTSPVTKKFFNYDDDTFNFGFPSTNHNFYFTFLIILLHPRSRGILKLNSADPFDYPIIDSNGLSDNDFVDVETVYEGVQLALKLLETKAFKDIGARLHRVHLPDCKEFDYMSRDYWYCHIRYFSSSMAHNVGTCKMGPSPLHGAVVDNRLKVYGIKNLRVADASIMPLVPGAHTNAPTMMIGEKAADMIRNLQN